MPKFIDAKSAFKIGARYDDGKRVNPFFIKPLDAAVMKQKTESDAQAKIVQSLNTLTHAVASHETAIAKIPVVKTDHSFIFDHQRDASNRITRTVVTGEQTSFVLDHERGADGRITRTTFTLRDE